MTTARFTLRSDRLSIGDGTMPFARFFVAAPPGDYRLGRGALIPVPPGTPREQVISLDGPYVFVVDSSLEEAFNTLFHDFAGPVNYDITRVLERHEELSAALGAHVAFYWEGSLNLSGQHSQGSYTLELLQLTPYSGS